MLTQISLWSLQDAYKDVETFLPLITTNFNSFREKAVHTRHSLSNCFIICEDESSLSAHRPRANLLQKIITLLISPGIQYQPFLSSGTLMTTLFFKVLITTIKPLTPILLLLNLLSSPDPFPSPSQGISQDNL